MDFTVYYHHYYYCIIINRRHTILKQNFHLVPIQLMDKLGMEEVSYHLQNIFPKSYSQVRDTKVKQSMMFISSGFFPIGIKIL